MVSWFADDDFLDTFSAVDFVTFFARGTVSPLVSRFTISWQLDTLVIAVQIIIAFAFNTNLFASINPAAVEFLFGINVSIFSTMVINYWRRSCYNTSTNTIYWSTPSWVTASTKSCTVVPFFTVIADSLTFSVFSHNTTRSACQTFGSVCTPAGTIVVIPQ